MSIKRTENKHHCYQRKTKGLNPVVVLLAITLQSVSAQASIIFDSFDAGGGFDRQSNFVAAGYYGSDILMDAPIIRMAVQFTITGSDSNFSSITFPISYSYSNNSLRVSLTENNGGLPGATLEVISENQSIWPVLENPFTATTTLTSATTPTLLNGSSYWIVTEPTFPADPNAIVDYRWFSNLSGAMVPILQQTVFGGGIPPDSWTGYSGFGDLAFRIEGSPVPIPATVWLFLAGILGFSIVDGGLSRLIKFNCRATGLGMAKTEKGANDMATTLLGTPNPRRMGFRKTL